MRLDADAGGVTIACTAVEARSHHGDYQNHWQFTHIA